MSIHLTNQIPSFGTISIHSNNQVQSFGTSQINDNQMQRPSSLILTDTLSTRDVQRPHHSIFHNIISRLNTIFSNVYNFLSKIPIIKWFVKKPEEASHHLISGQKERIRLLNEICIHKNSPHAASAPPLDQAAINRILEIFTEIQNDQIFENENEADAFYCVLNAANCTKEIALSCFHKLTPGGQELFKLCCYIANGNSSVYNGYDHGMGFGDFIVHNAILDDKFNLAASLFIRRYWGM